MSLKLGEGQLDDDEGSGELPGVKELGGGEDPETVPLESDDDGTIAESTLGIEIAARDEVIVESE
jgi:hypothetical protein